MPGSAVSLALVLAVLAPLVSPGSLMNVPALNPSWRVVTLPQQTLPVTRYSAEVVDGRAALRVQTDGSYGNLVHELPAAAAPRRLSWAWRMQQPNALADLRTKSGDDAAVKVCMSFDLPIDRVPFIERQLLRLARARTGQDLPAATLCWVWAGAEAKGALLDNPYTRRVRSIVLRNASDALGSWMEESRDVAADFVRAFGDESAELPPVTAVIVAGDSDNTGVSTRAHVSALRVEP